MLFRAESPHLNQLNSTKPQERNIKKIYISDKNIYSIIINRHSSSRNYKYELCLYDMSMNFAKIDYLNFTIITNNYVVYRWTMPRTLLLIIFNKFYYIDSHQRVQSFHIFPVLTICFWSVVKKRKHKNNKRVDKPLRNQTTQIVNHLNTAALINQS